MGQNGAWSVTIPSGTSASDSIPDGEQQITLTAKDGSGKETSVQLMAYIDNIGPTVLITVPQGYGGSKPIASDYIDIKGEVWDASPVDKVYVRLLDASGNQLAIQLAAGTNTWSTRFDISGLPDLTTYYYSVQATDRAVNQSAGYYHSQDIWALLPTGSLFPATDKLGLMSQSKTGTAGGIDYTTLSQYLLGYPGGTYADFGKNSDATVPVLHFSNLDPALPITSNVIGPKVPPSGYANPGPAGNLVAGATLKAWILPWSASPSWPASPNVDPADVTWNVIGSSVSFQINPKVAGAYIASGRYLVKVQVGASGTVSVATATCAFLVDSGAPQITAVTPADLSLVTRSVFATNPLQGQTGVEIRSQAVDDNSVQSFSATASLTSGGAALTGLVTATAIGPDDSTPQTGWHLIRVPLGAGTTDVWFDLQATDDSGNTVHRILHYVIDETPPTIAITTPSANAWIVGNSTAVSGTASDDNAAGVKTIYLWMGLASATPPADVTTWTKLDGNASWATTLPFGSSEGSYQLRAVAVDFAGNQSAAAVRTFFLDQAPPTIDETAINSTAQVYRNVHFTLSGHASDTNGLDTVTVSEKKNGGASTTVLSQTYGGANTNQAWSWTLPGTETDGTFEYTITATDVAGKTTTINRTVTLDTASPLLTISAPSANSWVDTANYTIRGTVSDGAGKGVASLAWSLDNATWTPITLSGLNWSTSIDVSGGGEGAKTLYLKASDGLNPDATANAAFSYDLVQPHHYRDGHQHHQPGVPDGGLHAGREHRGHQRGGQPPGGSLQERRPLYRRRLGPQERQERRLDLLQNRRLLGRPRR